MLQADPSESVVQSAPNLGPFFRMDNVSMTIAIARRFGERICILADTMITDRDQPRADIIPGQLKAIVISLQISIAYAGRVAIGIQAARICRVAVMKGGGIAEVIEILKKHSEAGLCEFLVVSHERGAEIFKVKAGIQSGAQEVHWVGDPNVTQRLNKILQMLDEATNNTLRHNPMLADVRTEESRFLGTFTNLFLTSPQVTTEVGGLVVSLLGSPYGHCYQQHAGAYSPGPITIGAPPHPNALPRGGDRYAYNFLESNHRGVAIAGAFLDEARFGFIYNPLEADEPQLFRNTTMQAVIDELANLGARSGGKPEHDC